MKKTIIYAVILSLVSMAAGVAVGAAVTERYVKERRQHFFSEFRERAGKRFEGMKELKYKLLDNLSDKLNLTADQKEKVKVILESSREEMTSTRKDAMTKVQSIREKTNEKIQAVLTLEQKEKFQKIISDFKQRRGEGKWSKGCPS